jgi:signal peptidase II
MPDLIGHLVFWPVFLIGLALDLFSKKAIFHWLEQRPDNNFVIIDGLLKLIAVQNAGAAFGIAAGRTKILIIFSIIALVVVIVFFLVSKRHRLHHIALGLFAAGICGNLYDRLFNEGLVRDFIDVVYWPKRHWPAFNLADSMLCIAVAIIAVSGLLSRPPKQPSSIAY